jgi:hypothetical protein
MDKELKREILFRGWNKKNKCWIYGYYIKNRGVHFVCADEFAIGKTWEDYEVEPETVGQYTGQTACIIKTDGTMQRGVKIFEDDVLADQDGKLLGTVKFDQILGLGWVLDKEGKQEALYDYTDRNDSKEAVIICTKFYQLDLKNMVKK